MLTSQGGYPGGLKNIMNPGPLARRVERLALAFLT